MYIPRYLEDGRLSLRFYEDRPGYLSIGSISFMPDIAREDSGYSESQNAHAHSASPVEVRKFFEASTVTVGDIVKRINEFSVNFPRSSEVSAQYANADDWTFLIVNKSIPVNTFKIIDYDFPFLDIPSRFFLSRHFCFAIVTNPTMVFNTAEVLPGKISIRDTSYFDETMFEIG